MRPVPVVRRPIAFVDQLSERGRGGSGVSRGSPGFIFSRDDDCRKPVAVRTPRGDVQLRLRAEG